VSGRTIFWLLAAGCWLLAVCSDASWSWYKNRQSEIQERRQRRMMSKHSYVEVLEEEPNRNWTISQRGRFEMEKR
jgi:hypothetical protein